MIQDMLPPIEFQSQSAHNADSAISIMNMFHPDLLIMDVNLPGIGGLELCRIVKDNPVWKNIPIIMISGAMRSTPDKVSGLKTGADDYVTKPFEPDELMARIRALLRRTMDAGHTDVVLRSGELSIDLSRRVVTLKDRAIKLTPKEFDLLSIFLRRKGHVLSRSYLLENIWGSTAQVSTRTVDVHITSLRSKLGRMGQCLQTESSVGYKFEESEL